MRCTVGCQAGRPPSSSAPITLIDGQRSARLLPHSASSFRRPDRNALAGSPRNVGGMSGTVFRRRAWHATQSAKVMPGASRTQPQPPKLGTLARRGSPTRPKRPTAGLPSGFRIVSESGLARPGKTRRHPAASRQHACNARTIPAQLGQLGNRFSALGTPRGERLVPSCTTRLAAMLCLNEGGSS